MRVRKHGTRVSPSTDAEVSAYGTLEADARTHREVSWVLKKIDADGVWAVGVCEVSADPSLQQDSTFRNVYAWESDSGKVMVRGTQLTSYNGYPVGKVFSEQGAVVKVTLDFKQRQLHLEKLKGAPVEVLGKVVKKWTIDNVAVGDGERYKLLVTLFTQSTNIRLVECSVQVR